MEDKPLVFELRVSKHKPSSFRKDRSHVCPFCDTAHLTGIYEQRDDMIWLHNKFPTLEHTVQTVLIETHEHTGDVSTYTKAHNRALMAFALDCYQKMVAQHRFQSVLWYKNFGPLSAGSLSHPHMQLVGLEDQDGYRYVSDQTFSGISVMHRADVTVNVATHPVQGYRELNIDSAHHADLEAWADMIQACVQFTLGPMFTGRCDSYNLFFYPLSGGEGTCCKIVPRFAAPPYFVGYKLSQVNDETSLEQTAEALRTFILKDSGLKF